MTNIFDGRMYASFANVWDDIGQVDNTTRPFDQFLERRLDGNNRYINALGQRFGWAPSTYGFDPPDEASAAWGCRGVFPMDLQANDSSVEVFMAGVVLGKVGVRLIPYVYAQNQLTELPGWVQPADSEWNQDDPVFRVSTKLPTGDVQEGKVVLTVWTRSITSTLLQTRTTNQIVFNNTDLNNSDAFVENNNWGPFDRRSFVVCTNDNRSWDVILRHFVTGKNINGFWCKLQALDGQPLGSSILTSTNVWEHRQASSIRPWSWWVETRRDSGLSSWSYRPRPQESMDAKIPVLGQHTATAGIHLDALASTPRVIGVGNSEFFKTPDSTYNTQLVRPRWNWVNNNEGGFKAWVKLDEVSIYPDWTDGWLDINATLLGLDVHSFRSSAQDFGVPAYGPQSEIEDINRLDIKHSFRLRLQKLVTVSTSMEWQDVTTQIVDDHNVQYWRSCSCFNKPILRLLEAAWHNDLYTTATFQVPDEYRTEPQSTFKEGQHTFRRSHEFRDLNWATPFHASIRVSRDVADRNQPMRLLLERQTPEPNQITMRNGWEIVNQEFSFERTKLYLTSLTVSNRAEVPQ